MKTVLPAVLLTLAALTTTLASPSAAAGANGASRIDNVTLGVIDLTPDNFERADYGINDLNARLMAYSNTLNNGGSYSQFAVWPEPFMGGQAQLPSSAGPGTAVATASIAVGNVAARAAADTALGAGNSLGADGYQQVALTLAPHSLLTVGGDLFAQARRTVAPGENYSVFSWASISISDTDGTTVTELDRESALRWDDPGATEATRQERFLLAFANPGESDLYLTLSFLAYTDITVNPVDAGGGVAPVPEPATWATLLAGLALTGTLLRRRLRGQCRHSDTASSFNGPARV
ncbi:PEPxxWA-CTERM sorting domain-containing protein [Duganella phyllosphaerae]|uniref:Ice-binding protein C-terminal domain-containing protein n=1 Tax=Duganella phyllosphaerae TaxID=762836 RepID=A0A1E7X784_9BURK|nr:PEPxxWA-CTERM sorting domain-containing protein [Duganella phyllosphaerae]OFA08987.1 hypothetical protein DUPY_03590 [Duganella phyllosphaerae]